MLIEGYRGRTVKNGDEVQVYRNLNNGKWSIKALHGEHKGKVVAHLDALGLTSVKFKISEASKRRAIAQQTRNVHAVAIGVLNVNCSSVQTGEVVTYSPFKKGYFHKVGCNEELTEVDGLAFCNGQARLI